MNKLPLVLPLPLLIAEEVRSGTLHIVQCSKMPKTHLGRSFRAMETTAAGIDIGPEMGISPSRLSRTDRIMQGDGDPHNHRLHI